MTWARVAVARLRGLFDRARMARDLEEEVQFHLEMQTADYLEAGLTPDKARCAARRSFSAIDPVKEGYRDRHTFVLFETTAQDVRFARRSLRRNPAFAAASIATLALAIGANTAMFSVLNAVLLRPLPYRSPEQLAMLWTEIPTPRVHEARSAYRDIEQWRRQSETFADIAFFDPVSATLTTGGAADHLTLGRVSPNFFPVLGIQPVHGRNFSVEETVRRERVALLSHRFWQSHLGGVPDAAGITIEIDGAPSRIVGILPGGPRRTNARCRRLGAAHPVP
jgi:hypothetical protein